MMRGHVEKNSCKRWHLKRQIGFCLWGKAKHSLQRHWGAGSAEGQRNTGLQCGVGEEGWRVRTWWGVRGDGKGWGYNSWLICSLIWRTLSDCCVTSPVPGAMNKEMGKIWPLPLWSP